jgi:LmbE family N-acetylglucosaminyl deacetylase
MSESQRIPYEAAAIAVPGARRVLVLAPHPDDEVFGCGGTAARFAAAGVPVRALILTDGGLYGRPPEGVPVTVARRREAEAAAIELGCEPPEFGPYQDRGLQAAADLPAFLAQRILASGADVVMAPSPWEIHPDHHATAMAVLQALPASCTLVQYEVGAPLQPSMLLDITPVLERKQRAMACFVSQLAMQRYDVHVGALNVLRTYTLPDTVQAAEGLRVATAQEARDDPYGLVYRGRLHPVAGFIPRPRTPA